MSTLLGRHPRNEGVFDTPQQREAACERDKAQQGAAGEYAADHPAKQDRRQTRH
jgi:hypothetical protein